MTRWNDAKGWDINWRTIKNLDSGKQASAKKVVNRHTGQEAFLKILNRQDEEERRCRFFREASAYESFQHPNLPRFIESNAHLHTDRIVKVYLAIELIEGSPLGSVIARRRPSFDEAVALTLRLLDVAEHFHREGWVHRDIKPDNIMLRGEDFADPVLVDFGVSYKESMTPDFATEVDQELGNRFFRLPEMAADSVTKQDSRTDLSFIGGILFFCLTGVSPQQPLNVDGKMPHQRATELKALQTVAKNAIMPLLTLFDRAFSQRFSGRFATAGEMAAELSRLLQTYQSGTTMPEYPDLESLRARAHSSSSVEFMRLMGVYETARFVIGSVHGWVLDKVRPTYQPHVQNWLDFSSGMKFEMGFHHFANPNHRFAPLFLIAPMGDEIVVRIGDDVVYRTEGANPNFDDARFRNELERRFANGLNALIDLEPRPAV